MEQLPSYDGGRPRHLPLNSEHLNLFENSNVLSKSNLTPQQNDLIIVDDDTTSDSPSVEVKEQTYLSFDTPQVVLAIGRPKRGKTNLIKFCILKNTAENHLWKFGLVFSKTAKLSKDYDFIPDEYKFTEYSQEVLETYLEHLEEFRKRGEDIAPSFIVFDDMLSLVNQRDPFLINLHAIHRHYNLTIFHSIQHLVTGSSTALRSIVSRACMFNVKDFNSIEALWKNFGARFDKYDDFKHFLLENTKEQYTCLVYENLGDESYYTFKAPDMSKNKLKLKY